MALPVEFGTVTLAGKYTGLDGTPIAGTVTFTAATTLIAATSHVIVVPKTLSVTLDVNGAFTIALPATNDPDISPSFTYRVTENPTGAVGRTYDIAIPFDTVGTLQLSDLAPAAAVALGAVFLTPTTASLVYMAPVAVAVGPGIDRTGATSSQTALQAKIDAMAASGGTLFIPNGTYKLTAPLNIPRRPGWTIQGESRVGTVLKQSTDNVAILNLGSDTASLMHSWAVTDLSFTYTNAQPSTNTGAVPILFSQMGFNGELNRLTFVRGSYAIRMASGIQRTWATTFDNISCESGVTIGAIHLTDGFGGTPNNHIGRISCDAAGMVGPIFSLTGYNFVIDTIEIFSAYLGPRIMNLSAADEVSIGAIKVENGTYAASGQMFDFNHGSRVNIGQLYIGGNAFTVSGATTFLTVIRTGSGGAGVGHLNIDGVTIAPTSITAGGAMYTVQASANAVATIGNIYLTGGAVLLDNGGTVSAETTTVNSQIRGALSQNLGDADYTATLVGLNRLAFSTTFTAIRTINLPAVNNNLFSGLYYECIFNGAINGANTALIKCNGVTLRTQTTDKVVVGFTYRRDPSFAQSGWVLTKYETIP